jgi:hypothetical protein
MARIVPDKISRNVTGADEVVKQFEATGGDQKRSPARSPIAKSS